MQTAAMRARPWQEKPSGWPIEGACLAALKDLGLSDRQVARYFRVDPHEVAVLRASCGIAETARTASPEPAKRRYLARRRRG